MQWEKATILRCVDPPALGELAEPAGEPLPPPELASDPPPHAAISRARAAVATIVATVRAAGGRARHGQRVTRVL
jgi:hypothetical protein